MEYVEFKALNIKPSRIALGTWAIGGWLWGGSDDQLSLKAIRHALDQGINIIDTAPVYGFGHSEEIVGRAVIESGIRDKIIIATKGGLQWDENEKITRNSDRERLIKEVDDSLRRLQTDYIDIYQVHWPDPRIPFEETGETMGRLLEEGKIRAVGTSNYSPRQMESFRIGGQLHCNQPPYNLFERGVEDEIMPYMKKNNIKMLAYGPICRGLLSGKMTVDTKFRGDDIRKNDPKFKSPKFEKYLAAVEELDKFATENYNKSVLELAVRWLLDRGAEIALWGARKPEQIDNVDNLWGWKICDQAMKKIDEIIEKHVPETVGPEFMAPMPRLKK